MFLSTMGIKFIERKHPLLLTATHFKDGRDFFCVFVRIMGCANSKVVPLEKKVRSGKYKGNDVIETDKTISSLIPTPRPRMNSSFTDIISIISIESLTSIEIEKSVTDLTFNNLKCNSSKESIGLDQTFIQRPKAAKGLRKFPNIILVKEYQETNNNSRESNGNIIMESSQDHLFNELASQRNILNNKAYISEEKSTEKKSMTNHLQTETSIEYDKFWDLKNNRNTRHHSYGIVH